MSDSMVSDTSSRGLNHTAALERVVSFAERFGENHFLLACHAAFPLAITPDLLYQVWINFVPQAPWTSVCDVLLSNLCREVGFELYEMDLTIRNLLLKEIEYDQRYGKQRLEEVADFLVKQVERQQLDTKDHELSLLGQLQQWTALAYTKPNRAAHELALELSRISEKSPEELFRLTLFTESLAEPLKDFAPLITYASAVSNLIRGNVSTAQSQLDSIVANNDQILISGVELPIPNLGYRKEKVKFESSRYTNFPKSYRPEFFVNREKELAYIKDRINRLARGVPFAPHERVVHFVGPSGIGKSYLLDKCYELIANEPTCVPILIKLETLGSGHGKFINKFLEAIDKEFSHYQKVPVEKRNGSLSKYGSDITRKISKHAEDRIVVLFLDEFNIPQKEELQGIEEHLLTRLLQDNKRAALITAGRSPAGLIDFSLRPRRENTFMLSAFDEETTGEQVEKLRSGSARLAGKIHELGGGVPGNNTKLAGHVVGDPPDIPDELQAVQSLLADVKQEIEERFYSVIEAICVLSAFHPDDAAPLLGSHPALGGQWDEARIRSVFIDLNKVQVGPGGLITWDREKRSWMLDEPTRLLFERELRMRDPELWKMLHCSAYKMYRKWGEELNSHLYKDKAVYHQQYLQSVEYDCEDK